MILDISLDMAPYKKDSTYTHTVKLARSLLDKGIELFLVSSGGEKDEVIEGIPAANLPLKTFETYRFGALKALYNNLYTLLWLLLNMKRYHPIEMIYERNNPIYLAGLLYAKIKGIPIIYEVNGVLDEENAFKHNITNPIFRRFLKIAFEFQLNNADAIIVQTQELKEALATRFDRQKIFVVNNGAEPIQELNKKEEEKASLVYVGILDKMHDLSELFQAVSKVEEDFDFYIIGGGTELENYKRQYSRDRRFTFLGRLNHREVLRIIEEKDCICLASYGSTNPVFLKYGFYYCPIKFIEYSMAENPTIVNKVSNSFIKGFKEKEGCLVVDTEEELIASLKELIKNRDRRREMGRAAREIAMTYTWERAAEETVNVFKRVVPLETEGESSFISVIVPAYNSSRTLPYCLDSLQAQTYRQYEVIVVDSSEDETTARLVERYPSVRLIRSGHRLDPGTARNLGVRYVGGDIIAFIDSDCVAGTDWLERINRGIGNGIAGVGGSVENYYDRNIVAWAEYFLEFSEFNEYKKRQYVDKIPSCNCSYIKEAFDRSGGFPDLRASEDDLFNQSFSCMGFRILFDPKIRIKHMNRTRLRPFLRNQMILGKGFYESRRLNERLNGSFFIKYPLFLLFFPFVRFLYRVKHAAKARMIMKFILLSPLTLLGAFAFTYGCIRGLLESRTCRYTE